MRRTPRTSRLLLAGLLVVTGGCQSYVFEPVSPAIIVVSNRTYQIKDTTNAEFLFVVDDSGSMAGEQKNLAANFGAFINAIEAENQKRVANGQKPIHYRLATTNTSISQNWIDGGGAKHHSTLYTNAIPGRDCLSNYQLDQSTPYPAGAFMAAPGNKKVLDSATMSDADIATQFEQNVQFGVCGSGQEQGLLAAKMALQKQPDFVQKDSTLVIAILSDEQDCSVPNNDLYLGSYSGGDACVHESTLPNEGRLGPVSNYTDFFKSVSSSVKVAVIVSAIRNTDGTVVSGRCDDPACDAACGTGDPTQFPCYCAPTDANCTANCVPSNAHTFPCYCGGTTGGSRYLEAASELPGSLADSICQDDFSKTLENIVSLAIPDRIVLDSTPHNNDPSLVLLEITRADGTQVVCKAPKAGQTCADGVDWAYEAGPPPAIKLCNQPNSQCKLEPGDTYKVSFVEQACTADQPCN